jgi:putative phosphotransacetylase
MVNKGGGFMHPKIVPIGVSARHVHLSSEHIEILFGPGAVLTKQKELTQPHLFAANETVTVYGPKGFLPNVRVVGPPRRETQLEITRSDGFLLGIDAPLRHSGDLDQTPGARIVGPAGEVILQKGVIVAARHLHLHTSDAERWGIKHMQMLKIRVGGARGLVFDQVLARVSDDFVLDLHIDTDEGNAAGVRTGDYGEIVD